MASIDLFSEYLENNIAQYIPTLIPAITQVYFQAYLIEGDKL